jgi:hypothetical protein
MPVINDEFEHVEYIELSLGSSTRLLSEEAKEFAAQQAMSELNFSYPVTKPFEQLWAIERGKRHAIDILRVEAAHRFKYKQLSLNHRFNHYNELLRVMDEKFEEALPELAGGMRTFYIESGFVYDIYGNDVTKAVNNLLG